MDTLRVIFDQTDSGPQACSGSWNMAVDQALLESAALSGAATLRFYGWEEPTVSLGYFQSHDEGKSHAASSNCAVVRRATGGGAIVHDAELTYSFATPVQRKTPRHAQDIYDLFHQTLVETLQEWNAGASLCAIDVRKRRRPEPFLCFQRRAEGDVLIDEVKIAGSAQRRHQRSLLQHGSVLLSASLKAPELSGLNDILGVRVDPSELALRWIPRLCERLALEPEAGKLSDAEISSAKLLQSERFTATMWTHRR